MRVAMNARGSGLHVGLFLWFLAGLRKSRTVRVKLSALPIGRGSADRGLRRLEAVGLVRVTRRRGRWPIVTILKGSQP